MAFFRAFYSCRAQNEKLLSELGLLIGRLRETSKSSEKLAIIKKQVDLHDFLRFFASFGPLHFTSRSIADAPLPSRSITSGEEDEIKLTELLGRLSMMTGGKDAKSMVIQFLTQHPDHRNTIMRLIDRNLQIRMSSQTLLKVIERAEGSLDSKSVGRLVTLRQHQPGDSFPQTSENLPVALGHIISRPTTMKYLERSLDAGQTWLVSRKLDGIRCLVRFEAEDTRPPVMYSRAGNRLGHLSALQGELSTLKFGVSRPVFLDGELVVMSNPGGDFTTQEDQFRSALSIVLQKPAGDRLRTSSERLVYYVFDLIIPDSPFALLSDRQELIRKALGDHPLSRIKLLPQAPITAHDQIAEFIGLSRQNRWEGLVLRRNAPFIGKRSDDIIKFKDFYEDEFEVVDCRLENMQTVRDGRCASERLLSAVLIKYNGVDVWVGSGFSLQERRTFAQNPERLIGSLITVRYFQVSKNSKNSQSSLRFPTVKAIYEGARNI